MEEDTLDNTPCNNLAYCSLSPTETLPHVNEEATSSHSQTFEHDSTESKMKESDFNAQKTRGPLVLDSTFNRTMLCPTLEVAAITRSESVQSFSEPIALTSE